MSKAERTQARILSITRQLFAEKGFSNVSVRGIARKAEVDPALIHNYFGSKEQLFATAVSEVALKAYNFEGIEELPQEIRAQAIVKSIDEGIQSKYGAAIIAQIRRTLSGDEKVLQYGFERIFKPNIRQITGVDDDLRLTLAASQLSGAIILRHLARVEPLASLSNADFARIIGTTVHNYLYE